MADHSGFTCPSRRSQSDCLAGQRHRIEWAREIPLHVHETTHHRFHDDSCVLFVQGLGPNRS